MKLSKEERGNRTMKKSFLKRALAAAIAVPVAVTQTVLFASFADDAADEAAAEVIDVDTFMSIPVDADIVEDNSTYVQESNWNLKMYAAVNAIAGTTYELDNVALADAISGEGSTYDLLRNAIASEGTVATATVNSDNVTVTVDVNYDYAEDVAEALSEKLKEQGVDFDVDIDTKPVTAQIVITIDTADLYASKTVTGSVEFVSSEGVSMTADELIDYAQYKLNLVRADVEDQVEEFGDFADLDAVDELFADYQAKLDAAADKLAAFEDASGSKSYSGSSANDILAQVKADEAEAHPTLVNKLGDTVSETLNNDTVLNVFTEVVAQINDAIADSTYSVDISVDDLATVAESLYDVNVDVNYGSGKVVATADGKTDDDLTDDELTTLYTYFDNLVAEDGLQVVEGSLTTYKLVEVEGDASDDFTGSVYFNVKRVITFETEEIEDTTEESTEDSTEDSTDATEESTDATEDSTEESTDATEDSTEDSTDATEDSTEDSTDATDDSTEDSSDDSSEPTTAEVETITVKTQDVNFYFSHDDAEFTFAQLIESAEITVTTYDEEGNAVAKETVDYDEDDFTFGVTAYEDIEGLSPALIYEEEGAPYTITDLYVFYKGELVEGAVAKAYIGVKGDADLDGTVNSVDAAAMLVYAAEVGSGNADAQIYATTNETLENFVYFLADVSGESKTHGADGSPLNSADAASTLVFAAMKGAGTELTDKALWYDELKVLD
jgi:hypothetical protein